MSDISKSYTIDVMDPEAKRRRDESWDRVFGKKMIAVTFEHDYSDFTDLWKKYYSQFMETKIVKIGDILRHDWGGTTKLLNDLQAELFRDYDIILYADVDEIIVPDPDEYCDLGHYLEFVKGGVVRATGYNVIEMPNDLPLDLTKPILEQRTNWAPDTNYNKTVIITEPTHYLNNHHIANDVAPDPQLILLHLRDADPQGCRERAEKIGSSFNENDFEYRRSIATPIPEKYRGII